MQCVPLRFFECCAPTLEESVGALNEKGATHITVATTMFTPGGSHSEIETTEILEQLRKQCPDITLRYAWPFDVDLVATMLATQVKQF
jgi:sirohydrochlorin cobaltochelatase